MYLSNILPILANLYRNVCIKLLANLNNDIINNHKSK